MSQAPLRIGETQDLPPSLEIDKFQHFHRQFGFWTKEVLNRTVARNAKATEQRTDETAFVDDPLANVTQLESPVIDFPAVFTTRTVGEVSVNTMQEWECTVDQIENAVVHSKARMLVGSSKEQEYLSIPLKEFSADDQLLLAPGTVFRLIIGFARKPNGSNARQAITYIRRYLPKERRGLDDMIRFLSEEKNAREASPRRD
jgi:hypothetical protein